MPNARIGFLRDQSTQSTLRRQEYLETVAGRSQAAREGALGACLGDRDGSPGWWRPVRAESGAAGLPERELRSRFVDQLRRDRVLLESFLLSHSTRKTRRLFGTVFGEPVSAPTVSQVVGHLEDQARAFHRRSLSDRYRYVYLDGLWVTLRKPVKVRKVILVALGVTECGEQNLLSFQLAPSESESCWWGFLSDMKARGICSPQLVITDGAAGLLKAVQALYPRSDHQRCGVHKAFEAAGQAADGRRHRSFRLAAVGVFEAQTESELRARLKDFTERSASREPKAVQAFLRGLDGCLTYLRYPPPLHK